MELAEALEVVKRNGYEPIKWQVSVTPGDQAVLGDFYEVSVQHDDQIITRRLVLSDWTVRYARDPKAPVRDTRRRAWLEACDALGDRLGVFE